MTKRYFIWRDESGNVHCDVLVISDKNKISIGETKYPITLEYPLKYITQYSNKYHGQEFDFGINTMSTADLSISILCDYFDVALTQQQLDEGGYAGWQYRMKFYLAFLANHRAYSQNFYISEVEIKLFIENCDAEVEATT